jgi:hypothetical protein
MGSERIDTNCYYEHILVKNMPKDKLSQSKVMISYFDSAGLSINDFVTKMPEIKYYYMNFDKSTFATRRYFTEAKKQWAGEYPYINLWKKYGYSPENRLGYVIMSRCKNDTSKWKIKTNINVGISEDDYVIWEETVLFNECDSCWYETNKNNELVKYFWELKDKKNIRPSEKLQIGEIYADTLKYIDIACDSCVLFIRPTIEQIEQLKSTYQDEEQFYIMADDASFYTANAIEYLESKNIDIFYLDSIKNVCFNKKDTFDFSNLAWDFVLYKKNKTPQIVKAIDLKYEFEYYYEPENEK